MMPSNTQRRDGDERRQSPVLPGSRVSEVAAQSQVRRNDESWVEIASQPSSSSLSSIGDEIVTTGLRIGAQTLPQRRRRLLQQHQAAQMPLSFVVANKPPTQAGGSSQEEYDETESEEDRLLTSSAEDVASLTPAVSSQRHPTEPRIAADAESSDDDDEATALGRPSNSPSFRPQPNAFSHPPNYIQNRSHSTNSIPPYQPPFSRPTLSQRSQTRVHRRGPNFMSPDYREENDAALRASLTTLLSCAAAARGLSKKDETVAGPSSMGAGIRPSTQPMDFRFVPESELMAEAPAPVATSGAPARTASSYSAPSAPASSTSSQIAGKSKRVASAAQPRSSRSTKKKRTSSPAGVEGEAPTYISPTLLAWVVSAGVVVLVSVVGFGAGYVIGREVGRSETTFGVGGGATTANTSASCGRELARSTSGGTLRRFRWGAGMAKSVAV